LLQRVVLHGALIVLSAVFLVPLIWLVGSSLKSDDQIRAFPPEWLPDLPYYSAESPYFDLSAKRPELCMLALGGLTFQGAAADAEGGTVATQDVGWETARDSTATPRPTQVDESQKGYVVEYEDSGEGVCGQATARIPWRTQLDGFANVTLRVHGDRSWRGLAVRLVTPVGVFRTQRPILISGGSWEDIILIRQAKGSIPWGTYRLLADRSGSASVGEAWMYVGVLSASRWQVILRKLLYNYPAGLTFIPFGKYLLNTLLICALVVLGTLVSCSLVAYGLARIRWRGRNGLFYVIIATMMLPFQVTMVPLFVVFARLGWVDTFLPLIVPAFFGNAFFIFLLRQFFLTIPDELADAARIDGCREWDIYWRIVLPLAKPALATVGLFAFMGTWNDYVGPLIYLSDASKYTLSLGLATFSSQYGSYPGMLMAVTAVMTIPIIILFFLAQRTFIQGITLTGIKG
jgi:multiple sugar transport system permease protein